MLELQDETRPLKYWHIIAEMLPGLIENGHQIAFRTGARYSLDCNYTDRAKALISWAVIDGLVAKQEVNVLGSGIMVTNYRLTPQGERMHRRLTSLRDRRVDEDGIEETILPNPF